MISEHRFEGFNPKFIVVGCFIEHDGKILMIKRHPLKPEGNTWAGPSGKVDAGETEGEAIVREVYEETGMEIDPEKLIFVERSYVRFPTFDFMYIFFRYILESESRPEVRLSVSEHTEYAWLTPKEALDLGSKLMQDEDYCIRRAYKIL
jgi:8-oxo-dGTP pyrophosphatase MutT (NUDIX family)